MANRRIFVTEGVPQKAETTEERLKKIEAHLAELRAEGVTIPKRGEVDTGSATYKAAFAKGYNSVKPAKAGDANEPVERIGNRSPEPPIERIDGSFKQPAQQKEPTDSKPGVERL
jgi:hypothetical protein